MEFKHKSVLLKETIEALQIRPDGIYVDGTLGGGGHSYEICRHLSEKGRLIGIDQDADAIEAAKERLGEFSDKVTIIRSNYCDMVKELENIGISSVDGIILDLGVSSYQLDTAERGFTYREGCMLPHTRFDFFSYFYFLQDNGAFVCFKIWSRTSPAVIPSIFACGFITRRWAHTS